MVDIFDLNEIEFEIEGCSLDNIINYNIYVVLKIIKEIYKEDDSLCRCSLCIEDAFALALNALPPKYIPANNCEKYIESDDYIPEKEIRGKIIAALEKIKKNPNH
jgi:competence protein ComFB